MKKLLKYTMLAAAGLMAASCEEAFTDLNPETLTPVATIQPNLTIEEFKTLFWNGSDICNEAGVAADANNYCIEIPARPDGSHYIISGRVISSDYDGNIFKCLYIQDETAALPMSINQYNLYLSHRRGQELVIDLTGMYVGKYNGMFQLGFPSYYDREDTYETSFMAPELFNSHCQLNGVPDAAAIDTIVVSDFSDLSPLSKWQGQLVRFNNARFANAGQPGQMLCDKYHSSGFNQSLNVNGGSVAVRTSGYAKFWNTPLPAESGDVVGILGYYGTQGWQLMLNDVNGLMNFGNPTVSGTKDHPYTIAEAIAMSGSSASGTGWVGGYIVGTLAPERTTITSNSDITWEAPFIMNNTLVIAADPTVREYTECVVVTLPEGSALETYGNLADNPDNLGRAFKVNGRFGREYDAAAVLGVDGKSGSFEIEGVSVPVDPSAGIPDGTGTSDSPYSVKQVLSMGNPGTKAWVEGFIVGVINYDNNSSLELGTPTTVASCVAIANTPDVTEKTQVVAIQLPQGDIRSQVNLVDNPGNLGRRVKFQGSLEKYFGIAGVKSVTAFAFDGSEPPAPAPGPDVPADGGTKEHPYTVAEVIALNNPGTTAWIKGYIVGWYNYDNNSALVTEASGAVDTCIALAATPGETDKTKTVAIQLPKGDIRSALNLKEHPENLGKAVSLQGSLEAYFGIPGLKSLTAYELDGQGGGSGGGDTPVVPSGGTEANPYTPEQVLAMAATDAEAWVEGYIVGWSPNGTFGANLTAGADANAANILLAGSATETDPAKMMPVQLKSGTDVRAALNLKDNPSNLGRRVALKGLLQTYFQRTALKETSAYTFK